LNPLGGLDESSPYRGKPTIRQYKRMVERILLSLPERFSDPFLTSSKWGLRRENKGLTGCNYRIFLGGGEFILKHPKKSNIFIALGIL